MASNALPDVPYKTSMLDSRGYLTPTWVAFFRELFNRVGKNIAPSNADLAGLVVDGTDGLVADVTTLQAQVVSLTSRITSLEGGLTAGRQL